MIKVKYGDDDGRVLTLKSKKPLRVIFMKYG